MHRGEWSVRVQRWLLTRYLDRVVAMGPVTRGDCESAGFAPDRIAMIPNGLDIQPMEPSRRPPVPPLRVVWLGKLRKEKRADLAVKAWREARIEGALILIGDGEERAAIDALIAASGEGPGAIEMKGLLDDPRPELGTAHVFLQSSDTEGLSNALLEAMSEGCASVATDVGETRFVLGGSGEGEVAEGSFVRAEAGLLVRPGDVKGMARALAALEDGELREAIGRAAAARCRANHDIASVARRYQELLSSLARDARGALAP
jgi:glycosyltransferase involved in cell wall biosynthesis